VKKPPVGPPSVRFVGVPGGVTSGGVPRPRVTNGERLPAASIARTPKLITIGGGGGMLWLVVVTVAIGAEPVLV
jgi:hypothetical protein